MNSNNNKILKALHTSGKNFRMNLHSIKKNKKTQKQNLRTKKKATFLPKFYALTNGIKKKQC